MLSNAFREGTVSVAVYGDWTHGFCRRIRLYNRDSPYSSVAVYGDGTYSLWNGSVAVQTNQKSATHSSIGLLPVLLIWLVDSMPNFVSGPITAVGCLLQYLGTFNPGFQYWFTKILGAISELLGNRIIGTGWYKVIFVAKFDWDITIPINRVGLLWGEVLHIWSDRSRLAFI